MLVLGGGAGAIVSQTFDPKDNVVNEVVRGATEGALGGSLVIKGGQYVSKILGKPKAYAQLLEGANEKAETALRMKANEILYGKEAAKN